jgi:hypothetical protein
LRLPAHVPCYCVWSFLKLYEARRNADVPWEEPLQFLQAMIKNRVKLNKNLVSAPSREHDFQGQFISSTWGSVFHLQEDPVAIHSFECLDQMGIMPLQEQRIVIDEITGGFRETP